LHSASSKFLGPNHGHEQINEEQQGNDAHDEVFHGVLLQFFAEANVKGADEEERDDNSNEDYVTHNGSPGQSQKSRVASDIRSPEILFAINPPCGGAADTSNPPNKLV